MAQLLFAVLIDPLRWFLAAKVAILNFQPSAYALFRTGAVGVCCACVEGAVCDLTQKV